MKAGEILSAESLQFSYGEKKIIQNISLKVNSGDVLGIAGASGSGKTTLLKILAAKLQPNTGQVLYKGTDIYTTGNQLLRGHEDIKIVDQDFDLMPYITVEENILRNSLSLSEQSRKRLIGHMKKQLRLSSIAGKKAVNTSGGQKQRIALATAIAAKPELLLLDEPFANLDYSLKAEIIELLQSKWKRPAMVVVTHEPADLLALCNRVIIMDKGRIIQSGSSREVYENPINAYAAKLLGPVNEPSGSVLKALGFDANRRFLRPHRLTIKKEGVKAKVVKSVFAGSYFSVSLLLSDYDELIIAHLPSHSSVVSGQEVKLGAD